MNANPQQLTVVDLDGAALGSLLIVSCERATQRRREIVFYMRAEGTHHGSPLHFGVHALRNIHCATPLLVSTLPIELFLTRVGPPSLDIGPFYIPSILQLSLFDRMRYSSLREYFHHCSRTSDFVMRG